MGRGCRAADTTLLSRAQPSSEQPVNTQPILCPLPPSGTCSLQSVLVPAAGSSVRPAVYHWSPGYSALFAAGGRSTGEGRKAVPPSNCHLSAHPPPTVLAPYCTHAVPAVPRHAERVYMWDLERENCIAQLNLPPLSGSGDAAAPPAVDHIAASCSSPLLYAADTSGTGAAAAPTAAAPAHARTCRPGVQVDVSYSVC